MELLKAMAADDYEQVIVMQNSATGLRGFIVIHDTNRGPAFGGVRIRAYANESEALEDGLRLARAMTYKAALAELPCGGGKAVIMEHAEMDRDEAFEAFGAVVESLRGRFFTARDVGIRDEDLAAIGRATSHVAIEPSAALGDVSEHTALGVWKGMRACLESAGIARPRVAVQGVGSVGMHLARILNREGAELILADADAGRAAGAAKELGARVSSPEEILFAECDVVSPCALGGVIHSEIVPRLRARIVCGCANNILATPEEGDALANRGILYAPDYLVNAGGLIRGVEFFLQGRSESRGSISKIYQRMKRVMELARERGISTARAADELAEQRWKRPAERPKKFRELPWSAPAWRKPAEPETGRLAQAGRFFRPPREQLIKQ